MKSLLAISLLLFSTWSYAQSLQATSFENQWEKPVELNQQTKWLVVSQSKESGNIVKEAFEALELADLNQHQLVYIADISAMPSFVTKLFALPKMRDYAFPMALIQEEGQLAAMKLPLKDNESVAVLALEQLQVGEIQYFSEMEAFKQFLQKNVL